MEETVWVYFGVVAVLIAIAIIASLFINFSEEGDWDVASTSVEQLGIQEELVCKAPKNTMLSIDVEIPGGSYLYTKQNKICITLDEQIKCVPTNCPVPNQELLNLSTEDARRLGTRDYTCAFLNQGDITITCQG